MLSVVVQRPGWSNGVTNGVGNSVGQCRGHKQRWDVRDSVVLSALGTWVDRRWGVKLLAALVERTSQMLQTALGTR